jgi:hypothetical protein
MAKSQELVPPFSVSWANFFQQTDPSLDPDNLVGPGKIWFEADDDVAPTVIVNAWIRKLDGSGWVKIAVGDGGSGLDADTLDGHDSTYFAPIASPTFTGAPAAPTAAPGTNTTRLATTAFVQAAITALINSAPGALDTLKELADALGDDANFASTMTTALSAKAPLASPALTGTPTVPTAAPGTNSTQAASTAYADAAVSASGASSPYSDQTILASQVFGA